MSIRQQRPMASPDDARGGLKSPADNIVRHKGYSRELV